jgi:hypothetical protein
MNADWQTWAAAGVVIITLAIFVNRLFGKKKRAGSCSACASAAPPLKRP